MISIKSISHFVLFQLVNPRGTILLFLGFKGFPQLQLAMISDLGIIKSFPIDGPVYETFPKFQLRGQVNHGSPSVL